MNKENFLRMPNLKITQQLYIKFIPKDAAFLEKSLST